MIRRFFMSKNSLRMIVRLGILLAAEVVLSRFLSISLWNIKIGFSFIPVVIAAILYGPIPAAAVAALGDFLGAILFPVGPYYPGFTFTAFLTGAVYGLFLEKKQSLPRILIAVLINQIPFSLFLNTLWISILYGKVYWPLFTSRIPQTPILIVFQMILIPVISKILPRIFRTDSVRHMTDEEAISYIENTGWSKTRLGLDRITVLLEKLGNPQKELKFVHVAGSNGKGSTCAMLEAILRAAGYRTGFYISPYIEDFCERIQVSGKNIPREDLARLTEQVKAAADQMDDHPSQFELVTAVGMLYFKEQHCDIVVLEVGMGGEFDATNVIDSPEVAVITNIGLEHTEYLGDTLEKIAAAKGGIIKPGCHVVCYESADQVLSVIRDICSQKEVPMTVALSSQIIPVSSDLSGQEFSWKGNSYHLNLLGPHQLRNASVVLETVSALREAGWNIPEESVHEGLSSVTWPARMEILSRSPLVILDGGHNPQCWEALSKALRQLLSGRKAVLLTGVLADKEYNLLPGYFEDIAQEYICVTPVSDRALSSEDLASFLSEKGAKATPFSEISDGIRAAMTAAGPDGIVVIFGSLYLAGAVRSQFRKSYSKD